mgnify:CR=1 FL=1
MERSDITTRADIEALVNAFYTHVKEDELIGHIFTEVIPLVWEIHMPIMYEFWETVLLHTGNYRGNPMLKHIEVDQKVRLTDAHFERWKALFFETLDELFVGPVAEDAKTRVRIIEQALKAKIAAASAK